MTAVNVSEDLRALASAIKFALHGMYKDAPEFFFILVRPNEDGTVMINTITEIQSPSNIRRIGQHLIDMADEEEPSLDLYDDTDCRGHA